MAATTIRSRPRPPGRPCTSQRRAGAGRALPSDAPAPAVHFPPSPGFTTVAFEGRAWASLTLVRTPALGGGCSVRVEALLDGSPAAAAGVRPGHCLRARSRAACRPRRRASSTPRATTGPPSATRGPSTSSSATAPGSRPCWRARHAGDNGLDGAWDGPLPPLPGLADLPSTPEADGHGAADELDADAVRQSGVGLVVAGVETGEAKTRLLVAGLPVLKHGRNGERREIVLRPTKHFDGVRWASRRGQAAGTCLFAEMASVDPAVEPHLARSFSLRLKSGGDRAALDFTAPSKEYALLTDGLNGVLLRPDKIVRHEAKRDRLVDVLRAEAEREARAARLRMLRPDYWCAAARAWCATTADDARLSVSELAGTRHTIRRARACAASRAKLSTQQLHSYAQSQRRLEHLHGLVHLYDDKHIPHVHRYPLAEGTYCELLFNANLSYGSSQPDVDVAPLVAVLEAKFTEGCYVKCRVVTYKKEQTAAALAADDVAGGTYALRYVDGPFDLGDGEALTCGARVVVDYRDLPANYWPAFIVLVSVVELGFFFYYGSKAETGISMAEPVGGPEDLWFRVFEPFSKASDRCGRVRPGYRVWSYSLVHRGLQHVLFNTVIQCIFGIPMEMVHGTRTLFLTYYMGVTLGALFAAAWVPYGSLVGASGGVYCLMGVHMGNLALNWRRMHRGLLNNWRRLGIYAFLLGIDFAHDAPGTCAEMAAYVASR
ncbi:hypothetical protein JL720_16614 [Aureococcus anophagefferens]|nr:hypothetical protein JL720_16614 [Aureococcus anophagefferens]